MAHRSLLSSVYFSLNMFFSLFPRLSPKRLLPLRRCHSLVDTRPKDVSICGKTYLTDDWTNVTPRILSLIGKRLYDTPHNPLQLISAGLTEHFSDSFDQFEYPSPVVTVEDNFDSLLIPKDHISRGKSDTYYVNSKHLLRCHTSAHQNHCLQAGSEAFICVADVYRRDAIDSTHYPVFHQCEGFKICRQLATVYPIRKHPKRNEFRQEFHEQTAVTIATVELHSTVEAYIRRLLGKDLKMRWVPAYFPFTHPSWELEIFYKDTWLEILGAGIVEHHIMCVNGYHERIAWAFGLGLERLAMLKYSIPDIRVMWSNDSGFLGQFKSLSPWDSYTFKPISKFPQLINDISFWLPTDGQFCSNDFYDLVRSVAGDLVERVDLIDEFTNKKNNKTSHCYRIYYRSHERTLTQEEINDVHTDVANAATKNLKVEIR